MVEPLWFEVPKSKRAPKRVRKAMDAGADLVLVWGDGMVQRCVDALAGSDVALGVCPRAPPTCSRPTWGSHGTSPAPCASRYAGCARVSTWAASTASGSRSWPASASTLMIRDADAGLKDRIGKLAYVVTGASGIRADPFRARIKIDRTSWFDGDVSSVLVGNVGTIMGGIEAFDDARPDDGVLEIGVVTADGAVEWARTLGRAAVGTTARSPFVQTVSGRRVRIKLDREMPYELDGGTARRPALKVDVEAAAVTVCVPPGSAFATPGARASEAAIGEKEVGRDRQEGAGEGEAPARKPGRSASWRDA